MTFGLEYRFDAVFARRPYFQKCLARESDILCYHLTEHARYNLGQCRCQTWKEHVNDHGRLGSYFYTLNLNVFSKNMVNIIHVSHRRIPIYR